MGVMLVGMALAFVAAAVGLWIAVWRHDAAGRADGPTAPAMIPVEQVRALETALAEARLTARGLAEADRAKSELLATLGARLRGPLNAIQGFAELARLRAEEEPDREPLTLRQAQAVDQILTAAEDLRALADTARDLALAETGEAAPGLERLDPQVLLRQAWAGLDAKAKAARMELRMAAPTPGLAVMAHRLRLERLLTMLLEAAIRGGRPGGAVLAEAGSGRAGVVVAIQGAGADAGLDMGMARRLAEALGGRLDTAEAPGRGVVFTLTLPAAPGVTEARTPLRPARTTQAVLLCVDPDPAAVTLMRHVAAALGSVEAHGADSAREGVALARALKPDLIVTALDLPDADGWRLKAALDADPLTRDIPVMALSVRGGEGERRRAAEAGFRDYWVKPADIRALARAIHGALGEARAAAA